MLKPALIGVLIGLLNFGSWSLSFGATLKPRGSQVGPSRESQLLLSNLWSTAHGERTQRPVMNGESEAPPVPSVGSMLSGAKNRFLEEARARVEKITQEARGSLSSSLQGGLSGGVGGLKNAAGKGQEAADALKRAQAELANIQQWNDFASQFYSSWKQEQAGFIKNLVSYQAGLVTERLSDRFRLKKKMKETTQALPAAVYVIPGSVDLPVRDQAARGTCASFTGTRVLEILAQQNGVPLDLSEQYFYWSSKSKCQTKKCSGSGSWFFEGYEYSLKSKAPNIPVEADCPYNPKSEEGNDTQIPLGEGCTKGRLRVKSYRILKDTHDEVVESMRNNLPVAGAFYLSENFFKNEGLVTQKGAQKSTREHSGGHAITLVGYMGLPESLWNDEGKVCFITANSWGRGWGSGGHACLTERWMQNHAISHFTVVDELEVL